MTLLAVVVGVWWLGVLLRFSRMWSVQVDYAYGWAVPFLALWLFIPRWKERPAPVVSGFRIGYGILTVLFAVIVAMALPILEANPLWPTILWPSAIALCGMTLCLLGIAGGTAWGRTFAFPVAFILIALPWPTMVLQPIALSLMRLNATLAAEVVSFLGRPAVVHGTVIEVTTGFVGIDEACSGMRSLQAILMAVFFFGEFYRFTVKGRIKMFFGGLFIAVFFNLCRTTFLTWKVAVDGLDAMTQWHDRAGNIELIVSLLSIWALGFYLDQNNSQTPKPSVDEVSAERGGITLPVGLAALLLALYGLAEGATQGWYGWHELRENKNVVRWTFRSPVPRPTNVEINAVTRDILLCDSSAGLAWADEQRRVWEAYFFTWRGGVAARGLPMIHSPEVCLPAGGARLKQDLGNITVHSAEGDIVFRVYRFSESNREYHVFFCLWDFRDKAPVVGRGSSPGDLTKYRLSYVREGRRSLDLAQLEVVLNGAKSDDEAVQLFREMLKTALVKV